MSADVAALAHSLCSIPNIKRSHRPVLPHHLWRNTNQHLSKHAPLFLPTTLLYAYICARTLVHCSTELDCRQYHLLPGPGVTSGALWCQSQKLALIPMQSLEILTHREKAAAEASSPCQLFPKSKKRQQALPLAQGCSVMFFGDQLGIFCQSPAGCSAGRAGCSSPLAQLEQPQATADCPKVFV